MSLVVVYIAMDEYLPEDGRKMPKHVGSLPRVCLLLCLIILQLLVYIYIMGRDSAVGIATRYGLDGPRIESRWW